MGFNSGFKGLTLILL